MRFADTAVEGAFVVSLEPIEDERGFFARSWCRREFAEHGVDVEFVQENVGYSVHEGTLRGLHFQHAPHAEVKLVRCTAGVVWDVAVDLRPTSPTFRSWAAAELSATGREMLLVPEGCAHGYLSLVEHAELRYLTSSYYEPSAASGVRFDDPAFGVAWPADVTVVSERDRTWPLFDDAQDSSG